MDLSSLLSPYAIREAVGLGAVICALIGAHYKSKLNTTGWYFSMASNFLWLAFAIMIFSPTTALANIIGAIICVRGIDNWTRNL